MVRALLTYCLFVLTNQLLKVRLRICQLLLMPALLISLALVALAALPL